ncbi:hypothetical protein MF628_08100 [Paenibacillus polymyxa]|uniref:hypothetical protein n=1 Tax=Paenibacillus polymyxa TaxID=1406 RepID=UPI002025593F|nr:hypothetical protein [Paenibacillus polymyxa]WDZ64001.1 hypothetical protein MF628_08100 [Paenibacillus polymyxa]
MIQTTKPNLNSGRTCVSTMTLTKSFKLLLALLMIGLALPTTSLSQAYALNVTAQEEVIPPLSSSYRLNADLKWTTNESQQKFIPQIIVHKTDYSSGLQYNEAFDFPGLALNIPKNAIPIEQAREEKHPGVTQHVYSIYTSGSMIYKNKVYFSAIIDQLDYKFFDTDNGAANFEINKDRYTKESFVYVYDLSSESLKLITNLSSKDKYISHLYPHLQYYQIEYNWEWISGNAPNEYRIYSLKDNSFVSQSKIPISIYTNSEYNHLWFSPEVTPGHLILNYDSVYRENNKNIIALGPDKKITPLHDENLAIRKKKNAIIGFGDNRKVKIGNIIYHKKWIDKRGWTSTITQNGKTQILNEINTSSDDYFSPNNRYLLLVERSYDYKARKYLPRTKIKVYDLKHNTWSQKIDALRDTAANDYPSVTWISDEFFLIRDLKHYYLHIPTGTISSGGDSYYLGGAFDFEYYFSFDLSNYISPVEPRAIKYNNTYIRYSGQGTFYNSEKKPYVPIEDFVNSFGGNYNAKTRTLQWKDQSITLSSKDTMVIKGCTYYSLEKLAVQIDKKLKPIKRSSSFIYGYELI